MDAETKRLYKLQADVIAAAGHPIRLAIIDFLKDGEQCVCDIAEHVDAGRPNVSRHLAVLLNAGIVAQRKDGLKMMYSLKTPCILKFAECATRTLEHNLKEQARMLAST